MSQGIKGGLVWEWLSALVLIVAGLCLLGPRTFAAWPVAVDSAELTLCAVVGGVPHSPGYPLWTRLAQAAVELQQGVHPVEAISRMVVLFAVMAAVCTRGLMRELGASSLASTAAAVLLFVVPQCVRTFSIPEVHSLDFLLISGCLWSLSRGVRRAQQHWSILGVVLAVLAIGHRPVNLVLVVAMAIGWRSVWIRTHAGLRGLVVGLLLQLTLYMDLWLRIHAADPVWVDQWAVGSAGAFLRFVSGLSFANFFVWNPLGSRLLGHGVELGTQAWTLLGLGLLAPFVVRPRRIGLSLMSLSIGHLIFISLYRTADLENFFLPALWVGVVVLGMSTARLPRSLPRWADMVLLGGVVGLGVINHRAIEAGGDQHREDELRALLESVPDDSVLIGDDWPIRTALVAIREIDGVGTGVEVASVTPDAHGAQRIEEWFRGEVALIQLEEHGEIMYPRPLRVIDSRLVPHLRDRGMMVEDAESGSWSVALRP